MDAGDPPELRRDVVDDYLKRSNVSHRQSILVAILGPRNTSLVSQWNAHIFASINGWAAWQQRVRHRWSAVVLQRPYQRIDGGTRASHQVSGFRREVEIVVAD